MTNLPRDRSVIAAAGSHDRRPTAPFRGGARTAGGEPSAESGIGDLLTAAEAGGPIPVPALAAVAEILCYLFRIDGAGRDEQSVDAEDPAR